jgi:predicted lipoprotein with Yx(FWY)xxD motif
MTRRMLTFSLLAALLSALLLPLASGSRTAVPANAVVKVAFNKTLKRSILVDARGFTLYMYSADLPNRPACYDDSTYHCSKAWPPLLTKGKPHAGAGVKAALLSTAKRTGGALQVQYRGHPLYTNAGAGQFGLVPDKKPGDVYGQRFLEIWWVLSPAGTPIRVRRP